MKRSWFRPLGWVYWPVSLPAWLLTAFVLALCVWVFLAVDRNSHSVSDTLIGTFPWVMIFAFLWNWVDSHTAGEA